jgi:hypothetical protein
MYTPQLISSSRYARVLMRNGGGSLIAAKLVAGGVIATATVSEGPGVSQDEATQLAADLAWTRDAVMWGLAPTKFAVWSSGHYKGMFAEPPTEQQIQKSWAKSSQAVEATPVVGEAPFNVVTPGGDGLPDDWAVTLAKACDCVNRKLKEARTSEQIPIGYSVENVALPLLPLVGIVVAGAAVATIASVAAWRYLDPEARTAVAAVKASSEAYKARVSEWKETGKMPPASDIEQTTARAVGELGHDGGMSSATQTALIMGGTLGAFGLGVGVSKLLL